MEAGTFQDYKFSASFDNFRGGHREPDEVKLVVVDARVGSIEIDNFTNLGDYLENTDVIALNDVGIGPTRLTGKVDGKNDVDVCFLLISDPQADPDVWDVVVMSEQAPPTSGIVSLGGGAISGRLLGKTLDFDGSYWIEKDRYQGYRGRLKLDPGQDLQAALTRSGKLMHPWYADLNQLEIEKLNQFTSKNTSVHPSEPARRITGAMRHQFAARGIETLPFSLAMNFSWQQATPQTELSEFNMNPEEYEFPQSSADLLTRAIAEGRRIVCAGTSAARTLESLPSASSASVGRTDIFISPGFGFRYTSTLLTNLHNPMGTHVIMACAFGGRDLVIEACEMAVREKLKFGIHGDSMLVIGSFTPEAYASKGR